ncbi:hypothetical protein AC578_1697 [Pseudocercospora eumusae]|uniref:Uncharacterized protein n=1 Tax=Pseudocercospora eumusae TaxID=321146 RepID=A0A139GUR3_9PEZI|nr:hypothetical protein AC578_1697 [Pseudocercospora eumusae]
MAPAHLTLFPNTQSATGVSRRPSLRRLQTDKASNANGQLQLNGVAFQVVNSAKVQPAPQAFQHSLFCDPPATSSTIPHPGTTTSVAGNGLIKRQSKTRRRSSLLPPPMPSVADPASPGGDQLAELPLNTHFGPSTSPKRSRSLLKRPHKPNNISTCVPRAIEFASPVDEKKDAVSPLPDKLRFKIAAPQSEHGKSLSQSPRSSSYPSSMRSIFPQYDHSRALDEQQYYPTTRAPPPSYRSPVVPQSHQLMPRDEVQRFDSAVGLVDRYEHIPAAGHADLEALWKASIESFPCDGRKVQFSLIQPAAGTSLAIGTSREDIIYQMDRVDSTKELSGKEYDINKLCPTAPCSTPVSHLVLPQINGPSNKKMSATAIFPRMAAMSAVEAISNSPQAAEIATFDPFATSKEAESLAQDAVTAAHADFSCDLIKRVRKRDSLGSVTAAYDLKHPSLGTFAITLTKSSSNKSATGPRAKISLHHPSATPAAIAADTLNLAFLDFAHDACVLDIPGILALDTHYVIDTVISALFAVAVIENDILIREQVTFEPPPKTAVQDGRKAEGKTLISSLTSKKCKKTEEPEKVELPGFGRAVVGLSWMAVKGAFWVVGTGVKVGVKIVKETLTRIIMATALDGKGDSHEEQDKPFRLLDLPPELWVEIGQMAVDEAAQSIRDYGEKLKVRSKVDFGVWPWTWSTAEQNKRLAQPAITKVCRALRQELLPYHYEAHVPLAICGCLIDWTPDRVKPWLLAIGRESRQKLRLVYLMCYEDTDEEDVRETFFADQILVEIGPSVAISETSKEYQEYLSFVGEPCCGQDRARKITFI